MCSVTAPVSLKGNTKHASAYCAAQCPLQNAFMGELNDQWSFWI